MLQALALVVGVTIGFVGCRMLRRPANSASAASVARNVGGALGARRNLSLPELQRATFSEMMRHVRVGPGGTTAVPVQYLVQLHRTDAQVVEESPRFFTDGLAEALREAATTHGWRMDGAVRINIEADETRRPGAPAVLAVPSGRPSSQAPAPPPEPTAPATVVQPSERPVARQNSSARPMLLRRTDTGQPFPLTTGAVTIGRSTDRDIVVDDNRVSRRHAVVAPHGSGWVVTDERSSNGTRLNGSALAANRAATLHGGDSIQVGPVTIRFEVDEERERAAPRPPGGAAADEATSVLDDATRRRISGEHLWSPDVNRRPISGGDGP